MKWTVPKTWEGETCVILAGGPSLQWFDSAPLWGKVRVITINDSWRLAPWADVNYFCDARWWQLQLANNRCARGGEPAFAEMVRTGSWVTIAREFTDHYHVRVLTRGSALGLDKDPGRLATGNNSGFQAINLAYHFGAKRIVLLGYDMHVSGKRSHWHDEDRSANFQNHCDRHFLPCFPSLVKPLKEAGVEVINATPGSALKVWPHLPLEEAINTPANPVASPKAAFPEVGVGDNYPLFPETT